MRKAVATTTTMAINGGLKSTGIFDGDWWMTTAAIGVGDGVGVGAGAGDGTLINCIACSGDLAGTIAVLISSVVVVF